LKYAERFRETRSKQSGVILQIIVNDDRTGDPSRVRSAKPPAADLNGGCRQILRRKHMSSKSKIAPALAGLAALVIGGVVAQAAQMKAGGPQPGDCKGTLSTAVGANPAVAQAMWVQMVASQYGKNWAHWAGAKNKAIVPLGPQSYQARATPCFYYPVQ
jgi:hypothetical protein